MGVVLRVLGILAGVAVVLAAGLLAASEWGGEVVVLRTRDADGRLAETRLWVVEDGGYLWLRAGQPGSGWYARLRAHPEVELVRAGAVAPYRAVPVPTEAARLRLNELLAEKYGLAEWLIGLSRDAARTVPVRLEPAAEPDPRPRPPRSPA